MKKKKKSHHEALTLINLRVNIWFDGKSVLSQAGFEIHLQHPKQKLRGVSKEQLINLQLCAGECEHLTIRLMREAM